MGKSELQTALSDWNKRAAKYATSGIPQSVYLPIAQSDFHHTYSNDAQPMTNLEADTAVYAAATQSQPLQESPRHGGGSGIIGDIKGDIGTVLSNLVPDATNIITGLPKGLYDTAKEAVTPKTYSTIAHNLSQVATGKTSGVGNDLRLLAGTPLLGLVPGLSDAAALTSKSGRESLLEHPITSVADIYPFLGPGTRLASAGAVAGLSDADRAALASSPSSLAAAAAGKPILFGLRTADRQVFTKAALSGYLGDTIKQLATRAQSAGIDPYFQVRGLNPDDSLGLGQYAVRKSLSRASLDKLGKSTSTAVSRQMGEVYHLSEKYKQQLNAIYEPILKEGGPSSLGTFSEKIRRGDFSNLSPAQSAALPQIREVESRIRERGLQSGDLVQTPEGVYAADTAPAKWYKRLQNQQEVVTAAQAKWDAELAHTADLQTRLNRTKFGGKVTNETESSRLSSLPVKVSTTTTHVSEREAKAARNLKSAQKKLERIQKAYHRSYIRNPPPLLHPHIRAQMRAHVEKAYRAKNNVAAPSPTDAELQQLAVQGKLSEFNQAISDIRHNPALDTLKSYLGDKEWKAMTEDLVTQAIKQAQAGFSPIYFHDVSASELEHGSTFHVNMVKDKARDTTEGAYREKSFKISTGSVFNVYAGQVQTGMESIARDGMEHLYSTYLTPLTKTQASLHQFYLTIAARTLPTRTMQSWENYATQLLNKEWTPYTFSNGFKWEVDNPTSTTTYLPKDVARNLQSFAKPDNKLFSSPAYRAGMKIFRTSVLYGPRHWAHVVIGGLMPMALSEPTAFLELARNWPAFLSLLRGNESDVLSAMPQLFRHPTNWTLDNAMDLHVGYKMGNVLKEYWNKTGTRLSDGMARFEDSAQSMYQFAVYLRQTKRGVSPDIAMEKARQVVVNLDSMSPFERNIMKQLMPFYSFTRFALQYMFQYPLDHPIRFSTLTQIGSQAAEDWNSSGLPLDMMSLIYFGKPNKSGNVFTVNYRNVNPFRSVFNVFTFGGFLSSLNPAISSAFAFTGGDVLSGTGNLYPKLAYNSQTGGVAASRPAGDFLGAAEQFIPELSWPDLWFSVTSNVKQSDPQAFQRALWNAANLPFTPSNYNIPVERGKEAASYYQVAQQAVSEYTHTLNPNGPINRFPYIPYQGHLYTPQQFETYYNSLAKQYEKLYPGIDPKSLIPSSSIY